MRILLFSLLLISCSRVRVSAYVANNSTIKVCGNLFTSFDEVEDEAGSICKNNLEVLECGREVTGYYEGTPIRVPCCIVRCPDYKNRRRK
jgi:hypothetical protein